MLYQNLWIKFRTEEMARKMSGDHGSLKVGDIIKNSIESKPARHINVEMQLSSSK